MRFSPPLQVLERGPGGEVSESPADLCTSVGSDTLVTPTLTQIHLYSHFNHPIASLYFQNSSTKTSHILKPKKHPSPTSNLT